MMHTSAEFSQILCFVVRNVHSHTVSSDGAILEPWHIPLDLLMHDETKSKNKIIKVPLKPFCL